MILQDLPLFRTKITCFWSGKSLLTEIRFLTVSQKEKENKTLVFVVLKGKFATKSVKLRADGKAGKCDFSYSFDGTKWISLDQNADATNLSPEKEGGFQSATIGLYATSHHLKRACSRKQ